MTRDYDEAYQPGPQKGDKPCLFVIGRIAIVCMALFSVLLWGR